MIRTRFSFFERLLCIVTSVRPGEGRSILLMLSQVFLLMHGYYLLRPLRDALILAEGSPELRAYATGAVALTLIFLVPLYKMLFDKLDSSGKKGDILRWIAAFFVTNMLIFSAMVAIGVPVATPFYIWVGVYSVMVVAQFWAFAADLFNIKAGQRLFVVIMIGAALGAATGSQVAGRLLPLLGVSGLMLLAAVLLATVALISRRAERSVPPESASSGADEVQAGSHNIAEVLGGFRVVSRSRYLLLIALFVLLLNCVNSTGGYILATFVDHHVAGLVADGAGEKGALFARFWGDYYTWVTALQLLLQLFIVSRLFRWFGIRGAILVLPLVMIANYALIAMVPVFALVRVMMIAENGVNYSVHGTTNHTLYLPVSREEKYVGKTTIDTFFWRFGDLVYASLIMVTAQVLAFEVGAIIAINLALAAVLLGLGVAIGRHHHAEIRHRLENRPPVRRTPLPNVYAPADQLLVFSVPDQAFLDPDPGDTLIYRAALAGGGPLPAWIQFDSYNQTFTLRPPAGEQGMLRIEVVATDFGGLSVRTQFSLAHGVGGLPQFTEPHAASAHAQEALQSDADAGIPPVPGGSPA